MPSTQYHSTFSHTADLDSEFGLPLALKKLDITLEEIEELVGRYVKGKNKGKLKGVLRWNKTTIGGWDRETQSVIYPGSRNYEICTKVWIQEAGCYALKGVFNRERVVNPPQ